MITNIRKVILRDTPGYAGHLKTLITLNYRNTKRGFSNGSLSCFILLPRPRIVVLLHVVWRYLYTFRQGREKVVGADKKLLSELTWTKNTTLGH